MKYQYWLDNTGLSNKKKRALLDRFQTAEEVYRQDQKAYGMIEGWKAEDTEKIGHKKKSWDIEREYEILKKKGIRICVQGQKDYPQRLEHLGNPPFALYYIGKLPDQSPGAAIVGARRCSEYGYYMAGKIAEALAGSAVSVISGLAEGIDAAGHSGAVRAGGRTYAVLGCGVDVCYPKKNRELYEQICQEGGILSEFPPGTTPRPGYFPVRNRIISGLADIVIVVEAKKRSGSLITADYALEQGKDVYALPGRVTDALSYGCNHLIDQGAGVILSVENLLEQLHLEKISEEKIPKNPKLCLAKEESMVYSCLSVETKSIEQIAEESSLGIARTAGILIKLAGRGLVKESFRRYCIEK